MRIHSDAHTRGYESASCTKHERFSGTTSLGGQDSARFHFVPRVKWLKSSRRDAKRTPCCTEMVAGRAVVVGLDAELHAMSPNAAHRIVGQGNQSFALLVVYLLAGALALALEAPGGGTCAGSVRQKRVRVLCAPRSSREASQALPLRFSHGRQA